MKTIHLSLLMATGWLVGSAALAQTEVVPVLGGGQEAAAQMIHIDLYYDVDANQFHARLDDSWGTPELRALPPACAFNSRSNYAVLSGKAYNSQYGWNAGGFFTLPPGAAIWIEQTNCSPGLEVYQDWGRLGSFTPIFGTAGSSRRWKWTGVMVHNTYAVRDPARARYLADYHIYFGDADTGSRAGFTQYADTVLRLEWTAVPVEDPLTFKFGGVAQTNRAPLHFLNADSFVTDSGFVVNLRATNGGPAAPRFEGTIALLAVAATVANGGPATDHAALGSCLELQLQSLDGPHGAQLGFWEPEDAQPRFSVSTGEVAGTNRFRLSETRGAPGDDPYGCIPGRRFAASQAGLYCLGFRLVDTSTNGLGGGPIHAASDLYRVYLQAGVTIAALTRQGPVLKAAFGGEPAKEFYLERAPALGPSAQWQTVAGPLAGTNRIQSLTDPAPASPRAFYRLRAHQP